MDKNEKILKLVSEYQGCTTNKVAIIKGLVDEHGYDSVALATGYKVSTLNQLVRGNLDKISTNRVEQALFVFKNLKSE